MGAPEKCQSNLQKIALVVVAGLASACTNGVEGTITSAELLISGNVVDLKIAKVYRRTESAFQENVVPLEFEFEASRPEGVIATLNLEMQVLSDRLGPLLNAPLIIDGTTEFRGFNREFKRGATHAFPLDYMTAQGTCATCRWDRTRGLALQTVTGSITFSEASDTALVGAFNARIIGGIPEVNTITALDLEVRFSQPR
jgi:hypothetical protein